MFSLTMPQQLNIRIYRLLDAFFAAGSISSICMSLVVGVLKLPPLVCAGVSAPLVGPDEEPFAA